MRRNDRIVFLGDSITEQQMYTNYVESYLSSRYPELNLSFFNAGWGGDTAPGGARRLDRDVLRLKPTLVTICFGMNDGGYVNPTDEIRERFLGGMRELVARLKAAGSRIVLLTPGMADERANANLAAVKYNTTGLRIMADEVLKLASAEGLPSFDLHKLMNEVDARGKAADPKFCMMPDGFHPMRGLTVDQERLQARLRKGANVFLLKITQGGGAWGYCMRFAGLQKPVTANFPKSAAMDPN